MQDSNLPADASSGAGRSELIAIFKSDANVRVTAGGLSAPEADTAPIQAVLDRFGAGLRPLFGASEEHVSAQLAELPSPSVPEGGQPLSHGVPDLTAYYRVDAPGVFAALTEAIPQMQNAGITFVAAESLVK